MGRWEGDSDRGGVCVHIADSLYYITESNTAL